MEKIIDDDKIAGRINAVSTLIEKLSSSNIGKLTMFGLFGVILVSIYEQRAIILTSIISSPSMGVAIGGAFLVILVCTLFIAIYNKMDMAQQQIYKIQQERIDHLEQEVLEDHKRIIEILSKLEGHP